MAEQVARWVDGLDMRVDRGILDTVVAINLKGIPTTSSCEGHLDHAYPAPWVDIGAPSSPFVARKTLGLQNAILKATYKVRVPAAGVKVVGFMTSPATRKAVAQVGELLEQFYLTHPRTEHALHLEPWTTGGARLVSRSLNNSTPEQRQSPAWSRSYLARTTEEMRAFTDFVTSTLGADYPEG
jgi:hypothetical protein